MTFLTKTRYGAMESYGEGADASRIVEALIVELETEQFEEPDDEHTQVAISNGNWSVTAYVSGLMELDDLSGITGRDDDVRPRALLTGRIAWVLSILVALAEGRVDIVKSAPWVSKEDLPPWRGDLFRA